MILSDENVPAGAVRRLRSQGFDVLSIAESAPGISDVAVLDIAVREQRILVSFDRDYGDLIFKRGHSAPIALIYFRIRPKSPEEVAEIVAWLLKDGAGPVADKMVIVRSNGVRERPLKKSI